MFIFGTKNDVTDEFKVLIKNLSFMRVTASSCHAELWDIMMGNINPLTPNDL
jgi:hypothetical protein